MISFAVFSSLFSFGWHGNKILDQGTPGVKLAFEIWKFETIVSSSLIKIILDIERIFSRFKKTQSTVEDVRVKYLSNNTIDHPHTKLLMLQISFLLLIMILFCGKERPIIHFENDF